jgi:hypothetical protein
LITRPRTIEIFDVTEGSIFITWQNNKVAEDVLEDLVADLGGQLEERAFGVLFDAAYG